jgi:Tol biopolymer transport system component
MPLASGTRVASYTIVSPIGAGGMGEVYRATDSKLKRQVAIKVLAPAFAADPERVARFQREAEVLAALNHPGIAAIYGLEEIGGTTAIVMELVEGPTLADRIALGPIAIEETLRIGRQIAEAVEAAHAQGIVHRDLKPANIKVRADGAVKVLDFGLAKALSASSDSAAAHSPTITSPATHAGVILGTAAYMSPEQARGKPLDTRTDIWSFGCVLYEMLTARRAFGGDDVSEVIASVLARAPDFSRLPPATPAAVRRVVQRCLEKDRQERIRDIGDIRIELRDALADPQPGMAVAPRLRGRWLAALAIAAIAVVGIAGMLAATWPSRESDPEPELRVDVTLPSRVVPFSPILAPDGRAIAFASAADGRVRLWVHSLESGSARALRGTEGANYPFWSPDSRHIAFFADGVLKRIDLEAESVRAVTRAPTRAGNGAWSANDVMLFVSLGRPISRVPASGGEAAIVEGLTQQGSNFSLSFLPDGRHFLYFVRGTTDARGVYVGHVDRPISPRRLVDADSGAVYAAGHLLFVRQRTLLAQRFDPGTLQVSGSPFPVAPDATSIVSRAAVSASHDGTILFQRAGTPRRPQFGWFDRGGSLVTELNAKLLPGFSSPSLSSDGDRVVFYAGAGANPDVWSFEIKRGAVSRLTNNAADDTGPVWAPDGRRIAFGSNREGRFTIFVKQAAVGAAESPLFSSAESKTATDWSPNGRLLLANVQSEKTAFDVWVVPVDSGEKPFPLIATDFEEMFARFSPDGRWIAYQSDESGRDEIYVQPFPGPGAKVQVSTEGGSQVHWRADGRELFYLGLDERMMAVSLRLPSTADAAPAVEAPVALFAAPFGGVVHQADFRPQYVVSPDGQRFLYGALPARPDTPASLILNWTPKPDQGR